MKPTALTILLALLALSFLGCNRLSEENGYHVIDPDRLDPQLLPYRFEQVSEIPLNSYPARLREQDRFDLVRRVSYGPFPGYVFTFLDSSVLYDIAQYNITADTSLHHPIPYIADLTNDGPDEMTLVYVLQDSLIIEIVDQSAELLRRRNLYLGRDTNGDGMREISGAPCNHIDTDGDRCDEILLQVSSGFDKTTRALILYDWAADSIRWVFDLPGVSHQWFAPVIKQRFPRPDTVFALATGSVCNGHVVGEWDDCTSYLFCVDADGRYRWHRQLARQHRSGLCAGLTTSAGEGRIVVYVPGDSVAGTPERLEALDLDGHVRDALDLPATVLRLIALGAFASGDALLAASLQDNTAFLLSENLRILRRLRSTVRVRPIVYQDLLNLGSPQLVLQMADNWLLLLDDNMRPLARLDNAADFDVLISRGDASPTVMVRTGGHSLLFAPRPNSPIMVMLLRYRMELLFLAAILASALIVTLFFQRRTRTNLLQIRAQKAELEQTHRALQTMQQKLVEAEKYKQAKDIAGAFAHEIRNALFPARFALNRLGKAEPTQTVASAEIPARVHDLNRAVTRAIDLTSLISQYTKLESEYKPEICNLAEAVASAVNDLSVPLCERGIAVTTDGPADTTVRFGRLHLGIVLTNLLRNSLDALAGQPGGAIDIRWSVASSTVLLTLADNGPGILAEIRQRIFDAFFTTKPDTGTGLGLATVRRLVDMYNGTVTLEDTDTPGCRFLLSLQSANPGTGD